MEMVLYFRLEKRTGFMSDFIGPYISNSKISWFIDSKRYDIYLVN